MVERFSDWDDWKKTLGQAVELGNTVGMSDDTIVAVGSKIGDFLDSVIDPENREQRVIKELWDVATEEEQKALTSILIKMVKTERELDKAMKK
ncbi:MAG: DUF3243 domain-containing protein [Halothermotrichaceae bacterium]